MMDDFVRFSDGDDEAAKRLMQAMREERPPEGAAGRALVALGVASSAVLAASSAAGAGASSAASQTTLWLAAKWLGAGTILGLVATGGAAVLRSSSETGAVRLDPPASVEVPVSRPISSAASEPSDPLPAPEPSAEPPRVGRSSVPVPPDPAIAEPVEPAAPPGPSPTARFEPPPVEDTLAREVELLDEARKALQRNAPSEALVVLDQFARTYPRGRLSAEAFVVRVDALVRAGRVPEARVLVDRYLSARPSSPHAARLRKLVGQETP
jgi:hypothetical protein